MDARGERGAAPPLHTVLPQGRGLLPPDLSWSGCAWEATRVQRGDVYFALEVPGRDGHDGIDEAIRRGAVAVVSERALTRSVPVYVVRDSHEALGQAVHALAGSPGERVTILGVLGGDGADPTARLATGALREGGHIVAFGGAGSPTFEIEDVGPTLLPFPGRSDGTNASDERETRDESTNGPPGEAPSADGRPRLRLVHPDRTDEATGEEATLAPECEIADGHPDTEHPDILPTAELFLAAGDPAEHSASDEPAPCDEPAVVANVRRLVYLAKEGYTHAVIPLTIDDLAHHAVAGLPLGGLVVAGRVPGLMGGGRIAQIKRLAGQIRQGGAVVVPTSDRAAVEAVDKLTVPTLTVGAGGFVTAEPLPGEMKGETRVVVRAGWEAVVVRVPTIGSDMLRATELSIATALLTEMPLPRAVRGLETEAERLYRSRTIETGLPVRIAVERTDATLSVWERVRALATKTSGRLIAVVGASQGATGGERAQLARMIEREADVMILTHSDHTAGRSKELEPLHEMLDGMARPEDAWVSPRRSAAVEHALDLARPGDTVVLILRMPPTDTECQTEKRDRRIVRAWQAEQTAPVRAVKKKKP